MPDALALAAMTLAAALCAWGARRDLQAPIWQTLAIFACVMAVAAFTGSGRIAPIAALILVCLLVAETDRRHTLIPDVFTLAVLALAPFMPFGDGFAMQLIGAAALGGTFLIIRQACSAWRGVEALGWGDVKFAAAMGAVLGPIHGFAAVGIAGAGTLVVVAARQRGGAVVLGAPFGIGLASATAVVAIVRAIAP
jgi:leader peptidase (prepilin peptidase)/N-methyltransferase